MTAPNEKDLRYLEKRIEELEKLMNAKFDAQQQAVEKSHGAMEARFESVNEFRATLSDQTKSFVTRSVYDSTLSDLSRRVNSMENRLAGYDGRALGYSAGVGFIVLILAIIAQVAGLGG